MREKLICEYQREMKIQLWAFQLKKLRNTLKIMNKYFVIGNPIEHSLSPLIHNYWFKKYKINGIYEKTKIETSGLRVLLRR